MAASHEIRTMIEKTSESTKNLHARASQLDQSILKFQEAADRNRLAASQGLEHSLEFKKQTGVLADLAEGFGQAA